MGGGACEVCIMVGCMIVCVFGCVGLGLSLYVVCCVCESSGDFESMSSGVLNGVVVWRDPRGLGLGNCPQTHPVASLRKSGRRASPGGPSWLMVMASHAFAWPVDTERVTLGIEHFVVLDCRNFAWGDLRVILVSSVGRHGCSLRIAQHTLTVRWVTKETNRYACMYI